MTRTVRPEPEASAELEDAALWYEGQRPGLGLEFVQAIDLALEQIAEWPQMFKRAAAPRRARNGQRAGVEAPWRNRASKSSEIFHPVSIFRNRGFSRTESNGISLKAGPEASRTSIDF
jgi:plasmid stabilization system protein ParE